MNKQTIEERLKKLEEIVKNLSPLNADKDPNGDEWITIGYDQIPKETFDRYGAKPFQIMKRKMRRDGVFLTNISWDDAKKESEKLGLRLPHITEQLVLLDAYKKEKGNYNDFLRIEELNYNGFIYYEWVDGPSPFFRGGYWSYGSNVGAEA
ncbi:MAG: hypothetical protein KGI72_05235, partial [Patescibacteria group bacterium]|nr:hypothetical protein [Patescibacteria group bacterium]